MVTGELIHNHPGHELAEPEKLPLGTVRTGSGRLSAAKDVGAESDKGVPFSAAQLARLDEALTLASRVTRLRFSVYLGDLGEDSRAGATALLDRLGAASADSVVVALDPQRRNLDIVTGQEAHARLADPGCKLAVMSMLASFTEGDLIGGLLSGLRMLSDQAGHG
jgi:Domain of unknown function (DUF5130)